MTIHELSGAWGTARVAELGGCVLSWRPAGGEDVLFVSRTAELTPGTMWHGGIPVCAPWFGAGQGDWEVPHVHGLVARVPWHTQSVEQDDDGARLVMTLSSADVDGVPGAQRYPDDLAYVLEVDVTAAALTVALTVSSPSRDVGVDLAFHPYLAVDATRTTLTGLEGITFQDPLNGWAPSVEDEVFAFDGLVDRVYATAPPLFVSDGARTRRLTNDGATSTVIWNPGEADAEVPADEAEDFVCVEFGNVRSRAVEIPAGGEHRLSLTIEV